MRSADRREARRVRRGRQPGSQQGQGHGKTRYLPVARTNLMVREDERVARREDLARRQERERRRLTTPRKLHGIVIVAERGQS